jgi:hypothetical protein
VSEFEKLRSRLSQIGGESDPYGGSDEVIGLLAVAEGLAEVIALLKPLVEMVTVKPEPVKLSGFTPRCQAEQGGIGCERTAGHYDPHENRTEGEKWFEHCHAPHQFAGEGKPRFCVLVTGHDGVHTDGDEGRFW